MDTDLFKHMSLLSSAFHRRMERRLQPLGIGYGQYGLLFAVSAHPGVSQDTLAERSLLDKSTVARSIAQLEKEGYIAREKNPADRRMMQVYPTEKALASLDEIKLHKRRSAGEMTAALSADELRGLEALLDKLIEANFKATYKD